MTFEYSDIESAFNEYKESSSEETLEILVQACQGLVRYYAKLYGGGYCFEDLCQAGYEGLLKSIQKFDPAHGTKFTTYASHAIIGEIRHYVRKESRYYYPDCLKEYQEKMDFLISNHIETEEGPISSEELANKLNLKEKSIEAVMGAGLVHLDHIELASIKVKQMENFTLPIEDKILLSQIKYRLTDIQKNVIEMLFQKDKTQEEVALELGLTQKQVSRIKQKSLQKMKESLNGEKKT